VFALGLRAGRLTAVVEDLDEWDLPVHRWCATASRSDRALLDDCVGLTIDLGCGPGRLTAELVARGHVVIGVDSSGPAVAQAVARGVMVVVQQDLFDPVPDEGDWDTALLADGNVGIGGDPVRVLSRAREVVHRGGRVVVELSRPGTGFRVDRVHLRVGELRSRPFRWARVDPDAVTDVAVAAGLRLREVRHRAHRWWAVLEPGGNQCLGPR
jgi:SAM-dependent methyltransferase